MAKPLDFEWTEVIAQRIKEAREIIKVKETVEVLQAFALGEEIDGQKVRLSKEQIKAAEILLKKILPDLKALEVTGAGGGPISVSVTRIELVDLDGSGSSKDTT